MGFIPFSPNSPITLNTLHGRYYLDNRIALRLGFNFKNSGNTFEYPVTIASDPYTNKKVEKYTVIGISPGFEYHLFEGSRVSPYIGFEITYENKTSEASYEEYGQYYTGSGYEIEMTETEYKNAWRTITSYTSSAGGTYTITGQGERGYQKIGANAVIGADIYLVKHLYLGLELGFGYNSVKHKEIEITATESTTTFPATSGHEFGLNVNNSLRLGFWF